MAIALDTNNESGVLSASTSHTWSHTCTGSDRLLVVSFVSFDSPYDIATGVTYNGVSMTLAGKKFHTGGRGTYTYVLINPATGANNVVVSLSSSGRIQYDSVSYTGCDQTTQPDVVGTQESTSSTITMSLTTTVDDCWLYAGMYVNRTQTAGAGTVLRGTGSNAVSCDSNGSVGTAGSHSLVTTQSDSTYADQVYIAIAPAGGAPPATVKPQFLGFAGL